MTDKTTQPSLEQTLLVRNVQLDVAMGILREVMPEQLAVKLVNEMVKMRLSQVDQEMKGVVETMSEEQEVSNAEVENLFRGDYDAD